MINIGFAGPPFTQSNHRPLSNLVQERINGVVVNPNGSNLHPKVAIYHLEKTHSDHCLIKLCFQRPQGFQLPRPFIFQPMWLSHPSFLRVVREACTNPPTLHQAIASFTEKENIQNRAQFGNLFQRKKSVLVRLIGIQESLPINPNNYLINLEKNLRVEFSKIQGEFLAMKSWISWLVEGDRNVSFYRTSTLVCRRRNRISYVKYRMRNWINGDREIADFNQENL